MGRAEDLFRRLSEDGIETVDALIADRQSEELFLDFKRSADSGVGKRLHDSDRWNLAKAISGFGNSEGGVIIWGVDCRDIEGIGDVANAQVPIQKPKRFVSWLEGAVSGCTVPAHPLVRHMAIELPSTEVGFAVTHIPKSYLAPHQCLKPLQYYIRSVLHPSGLRFCHYAARGSLRSLWSKPSTLRFSHVELSPAKVVAKSSAQMAAEFAIGFMLGSHGPGVARDLYVNLRISSPEGPSTAAVSISDQTNWTGHCAFRAVWNLVSRDSFKLAPEAMVQPIVLYLSFAPPFESEFWYKITFGHHSSPVRKVEA
jgi:hypothetical protein